MPELIRLTATSPVIQPGGKETKPKRHAAITPVVEGERVNEAATFRRAVMKFMGLGYVTINVLRIEAPGLEIDGAWYFAMGEWSRTQHA